MKMIDFGGAGSPVHFAHANGYPPGSYQRMLAPVVERHRVEAIRFRPLWEPADEQSDIRGWHLLAHDLIELIEQRFDEPVIGVGHSMGGVATLFAAVERPALFRSLILIDPVFLPLKYVLALRLSPERHRQRMPLIRKARNRPHHWPDRQAAFDFHRRARAFQRLSDGALWDYIRAGTRDTPDGVELAYPGAWEARVYGTVPHVWRRLARCRVPMLGIRGVDSSVVDRSAWLRWQRVKSDASFVEIPDSGHLVPMEQPTRTAAAILDYLAATA